MEPASDKPKGHILVVDDDPHAVEILSRMLGREGHTCTGASSGRAALERLRESADAIDVILLDVMMPEMDGLQVCQRLRDDPQWRQIPVILLTAKDDFETRIRAMQLGVSEFLTKPINKRELFERVSTQVGSRQRARQLETRPLPPGPEPPAR